MRILGIDYGRARLGIAVSDEEKEQALPLVTLPMQKPLVALEQLRRIIGEKDVKEIVVGLPLNLKMQETEETRRAKLFAKTLQDKFHLPVHLENEVLSTRVLSRADTKRPRRPRRKRGHALSADALAAAEILQGFLDRQAVM